MSSSAIDCDDLIVGNSYRVSIINACDTDFVVCYVGRRKDCDEPADNSVLQFRTAERLLLSWEYVDAATNCIFYPIAVK
jgi:hypothetical protein